MARDPVVIELMEPIQAHGETLTELKIRPPNAGDVMACGNPVNMSGSTSGGSVDINVNPENIGRLLSRLTAVPPSSIATLSMADFIKCQGAVMGFMAPPGASPEEAPLSSTDTSTSPGPGNVIPVTSLRSAGIN